MAKSTTPILDVRGVSKRFEINGMRIQALENANLTVTKGEFVCLIGASGCGKSTLLRIVAGFESPSAGEALMWGKPISGPAPDRGMVFQDYALFPWLTVRQNIGFGRRRAASATPSSRRPSTASSIWSGSGSSRTPIPISSRAA